MTYRTSQQIYPPNYEFALIEKDAQQQCGRIWAEAVYCQNMQHIYREINQEVDPYNREYLVTVMHEMIQDKSTSDDYDSVRLTSYQMEQLEADERRVITKARSEQWAEQTDKATIFANEPNEKQARVYTEYAYANFKFMRSEMQDLKTRMVNLEASIHASSQTSYIWPTYTNKATEDDKKNFENTLRVFCTSGKKTMSSDAKRYIRSQAMKGIIVRPGNLAIEHTYLIQFGYPYKDKAYYAASES